MGPVIVVAFEDTCGNLINLVQTTDDWGRMAPEAAMAELTLTTFLSLDGVMQAPGGPGEDESGASPTAAGLPHVDPVFGETIVGSSRTPTPSSSAGGRTTSSRRTGPGSPTPRIPWRRR